MAQKDGMREKDRYSRETKQCTFLRERQIGGDREPHIHNFLSRVSKGSISSCMPDAKMYNACMPHIISLDHLVPHLEGQLWMAQSLIAVSPSL